MKRFGLFLAFFLSLVANVAFADGNNYGSAAYLRLGVGSRASGMGGAFTALADDATAGYWNPAGLSQMELYMYEVGSQYTFLPNNLSAGYLSYSFQMPEWGGFSVSWLNFVTGDIDLRDSAGISAGSVNSSENTFMLSYGRKIYEWVRGLSLGASLKVLQQGLGTASAAGPGLDVGVLWQPALQYDHMLGLSVQNLFQRLYWNTDAKMADASLVTVKLGMALKFMRSDEELFFDRLITAVDLEFTEYHRFTLHAGAEYWFFKSLGVRAGTNGQEITAGASYRPDYYEVDYAFHYDLSDLGAHQHRISVLLRFK